MKYDVVLKGGLLLDIQNRVRKVTDIAVREGKIAALGENLDGNTVWDVSGKTVLPGVIDMHVQLQPPYHNSLLKIFFFRAPRKEK